MHINFANVSGISFNAFFWSVANLRHLRNFRQLIHVSWMYISSYNSFFANVSRNIKIIIEEAGLIFLIYINFELYKKMFVTDEFAERIIYTTSKCEKCTLIKMF